MSHTKIKRHFKKTDPIIHQEMKDLDFNKWFKPRIQKRVERGYFNALCREIIGQQLSGKVAKVISSRFTHLFNQPTITPQQVLKISDQSLRDVGLSWAKVSYIKDLAEKTKSKQINFKNLHQLADKAVTDELTQVKGIGPWTAEMFLMFTLGREDIFSHGDLGLKRGIEKLYKLKDPDANQINRIVEPWSPYKSYGSITLWQAVDQ